MFDALPEADGVYIESADEAGGCGCSVCNKPIDSFGSKQFGQSQLTLAQEIMQAIWRDHPHARLAYTIGYEPHKQDPAYYEVIRQMSDPRIEWMEARRSSSFPGPGGKPLPAAYFSRHLLSWRYHDLHPLEKLLEDIRLAGTEGWYGAISTFSPGFSTGSFYKDIPFPTDLLPYVLTHFLHREATWEPALSVEEARQRVQRRFFGREAPEQLGLDLWALREILRTSSRGTWGVTNKLWQYLGKAKATPEAFDQADQIEKRVKQARATAGPKTLETLNLMTRAIDDLRKLAKGPELR
jgi:hypothetical protein